MKGPPLATVRRWLPPAAWDALRARVGTRFSGNYASWEEAARACEGYDAPEVLSRVAEATRAVVSGNAAYERDSILFDRIEYSWPVLASLLWVAAQKQGRLKVLDLGGALGSSYLQNAKFLAALPEVSWLVVEQTNFAELGRREFQNERLRFHDDLPSCLSTTKPDAVLCSSVLQYLEDPYAALDLFAEHRVPFLVIDRTPFIASANDRLTIQIVSKRVYPASYPAWFFSREKFMRTLGRTYRLVEEFESTDRASNVPSTYLGLLFARI